MHMGFGGLHGRGAKAKDPPIERDLALSLEEVYHGCVKKMKISRRVGMIPQPLHTGCAKDGKVLLLLITPSHPNLSHRTPTGTVLLLFEI